MNPYEKAGRVRMIVPKLKGCVLVATLFSSISPEPYIIFTLILIYLGACITDKRKRKETTDIMLTS